MLTWLLDEKGKRYPYTEWPKGIHKPCQKHPDHTTYQGMNSEGQSRSEATVVHGVESAGYTEHSIRFARCAMMRLPRTLITLSHSAG